MARWLDAFPRRQTDPMWRAETYVDRALGMPDPAEDARLRRAQLCTARAVPRPVVVYRGVAPDYNTMRPGTIYVVGNQVYIRGATAAVRLDT